MKGVEIVLTCAASPQFGCPATSQYYVPEVFTCQVSTLRFFFGDISLSAIDALQEKIFQSLLNQTLINPVGAKYVYSDLRFALSLSLVYCCMCVSYVLCVQHDHADVRRRQFGAHAGLHHAR
jgi:hypothetical protein